MFSTLIRSIGPQLKNWNTRSPLSAGLHTSSVHFAEPPKKKKRIDPVIEQNRLRRKVRRIEKEIKRFTRQERQLKPVEEIEGDRQLYKQLDQRKRPSVDVSEDEIDRRASLLKEWARFQSQRNRSEREQFKRALDAQRRALDWLYLTSPELYKAAIQPCLTVTEQPDAILGPRTLPIEGLKGPYYSAPRVHGDCADCSAEYDPPDGEIVDSTIAFNYEFDLDRQFLADPTKKGKDTWRSNKDPSNKRTTAVTSD
ncbi:unnamed protein product [Dicrocoelium dendriticum]|nr:unnamed protein product [Dicrocoelium dendriticum]